MRSESRRPGSRALSRAGWCAGVGALLALSGCADDAAGEPEGSSGDAEASDEAGADDGEGRDGVQADRGDAGEEPAVPREETAEAEELFEEFQQLVSEVPGFEAEGVTVVEGQTQTAELTFDAGAEGFEGTVEVSDEGADLELEIIRATGLTWIKGPAAYWETLGYPPEGAEVAEGMYVVFEVAAGDAVAEPYDYAQLLDQTGSMAVSEIEVEGRVEREDRDFYRYVLGGRDDAPGLELPAEGGFDSARYISAADGLEADVHFSGFGTDEDVEPPPPDEVLRDAD